MDEIKLSTAEIAQVEDALNHEDDPNPALDALIKRDAARIHDVRIVEAD